ncbi:hypothetical protein DXG01_008326 [Tephrocybe rancida]|nr:hypothetical protein DXG01_008326 [Tephrocybe rancida]
MFKRPHSPDLEEHHIPSHALFICDHEICGRGFNTMATLNYHKRSCPSSKKRMMDALPIARELFMQRKRARIQSYLLNPESGASGPSENTVVETPFETLSLPGHADINTTYLESDTGPNNVSSPLQSAIAIEQPVLETGPSIQLADPNVLPERPQRPRRLPARYRDVPPQAPPPLSGETQPPAPVSSSLAQPDSLVTSQTSALKSFTTPANIFGIFCRFFCAEVPSLDPEAYRGPEDLSKIQALGTEGFLSPLLESIISTAVANPNYFPYDNASSFTLGEWYWNNGVQKSLSDFRTLVTIVNNPDFKPEDVWNTRWTEVNKILAGSIIDDDDDNAEWLDDGWKCTPVSIQVPFHQRTKHKGAEPYLVGELYHRSIIAVLKERVALPDKGQELFYFQPFELLWNTPGHGLHQPPITRIHGELFTSDSFLNAHRELLQSPPEPGCDAPRAIAALMMWSDATHLTSFGEAKLWPAYLFFGNNSKYSRCRPSRHLANHIAYFRKLPDSFKDFYTEHSGGSKPSAELMAHCHREVFHAQWEALLDDEFLEAWGHGVLIVCSDGITRRIYPRLFTYSADYPEKVLIAGIRNRGGCPCPRCLVPMESLYRMGTMSDMETRASHVRDHEVDRELVAEARAHVYGHNYAVKSDKVELLLKPTSLLPSKNAFSDRLSALGFNFYQMLVVDLLHEFELGVWRALLIHLIRLLYAIDSSKVDELDRRYRQVPRFGGAIRKISTNVSELKKLAAHNFEDLLQCAMPAFDGLFPPPHNELIQRLLFECAHWHSLAKLRMHTDITLILLENSTTSLGELFREFVGSTCAAYTTYELPRELDARLRKQTKKSKKNLTGGQPPPMPLRQFGQEESDPRQGQLSSTPSSATPSTNDSSTIVSTALASGVTTVSESASAGSTHPSATSESRNAPPVAVGTGKPLKKHEKTFNLATYKFHSLADYASTIRRFGTCDSYSTEPGELEHRSPKARYRRTSRKNYVRQMALIERRQAHLRQIRARVTAATTGSGRRLEDEDDDDSAPEFATHHKIGKSENVSENIALFYKSNLSDPALKDFIRRLKHHLLPRIRETLGFEDEGGGDWERIAFHRDRMYTHRIMRVNITRYDVRRGEDIIRTGATPQSNIMMINPNFGLDAGPSASPQDLLDCRYPFWYAQVIGIYHVNVIYIGEGNHDYQPRRLEYLWVRWYNIRHIGGWESRTLDQVELLPPDDVESFAFLDPDFVDRDMMLRYHWQAGVGHTYSRNQFQGPADARQATSGSLVVEAPISGPLSLEPASGQFSSEENPCEDSDCEDGKSEHSLMGSHDDDCWDDSELLDVDAESGGEEPYYD